MNSLVLHFGIPKTGSSAIQVFLARNHAALLRTGVDYLNIGEFNMGVDGKISSGNGALLARCLLPAGANAKITRSEPHISEAMDAIKASAAETGLISSEMFVDADPKLMREFLESLRKIGISPRVFYFIRAQDQFLMSSYIQQVKRHQFTGDPNDFALKAMKNIFHIRYDTYYRSMCELFGAEKVVIRTFEAAQNTPDGLLHSVLQALSINPIGLAFGTPDVNTGISGPELQLMLALNRFKPRMQFSDMVVQNAQLRSASKSGTIHTLLNPETIASIKSFFEEENRHLANSYFHRDELFPPMVGASPIPGPEEPVLSGLELADIVRFFGALIVRLDERIAILERMIGGVKEPRRPDA